MHKTQLEIERKFLVDSKFQPETLPYTKISIARQGYIMPQGIRLRYSHNNKDEVFYRMEYKTRTDVAIARMEYSNDIPPEFFEALWPLTKGHRVIKTRYIMPFAGNHLMEIDVYHNLPTKLITMEIEFESVKESEAFDTIAQLPEWVIREVTHDPQYMNINLAR